jgi:hypothetical protein
MLRSDEMTAMRTATNAHARANAIAAGALCMLRWEFIGGSLQLLFGAMTAL